MIAFTQNHQAYISNWRTILHPSLQYSNTLLLTYMHTYVHTHNIHIYIYTYTKDTYSHIQKCTHRDIHKHVASECKHAWSLTYTSHIDTYTLVMNTQTHAYSWNKIVNNHVGYHLPWKQLQLHSVDTWCKTWRFGDPGSLHPPHSPFGSWTSFLCRCTPQRCCTWKGSKAGVTHGHKTDRCYTSTQSRQVLHRDRK